MLSHSSNVGVACPSFVGIDAVVYVSDVDQKQTLCKEIPRRWSCVSASAQDFRMWMDASYAMMIEKVRYCTATTLLLSNDFQSPSLRVCRSTVTSPSLSIIDES